MKDPARFLNGLEITVSCIVDESKAAVIDDAHRTSIGYETFFFSDDQAKARFDKDVARYCGILTDPVAKVRFRPDKTSPHMLHGDRDYFFASDSTRQVFAMMPAMYADPAYKMLSKPGEMSEPQ